MTQKLLDTAGTASTNSSKSRGPLGLLLLDDPGAPNAVKRSPYIAARIVEGCTVDRLIFSADSALQGPMITAARSLVAEGARAIIGDCGFMMRHQTAVSNAVDVPVFLSSLLLAPMLLACLGDSRKLGVITASVASLDDRLLKEAGVLDPRRIVMGDLGDKPAFKSGYMDCDAMPDVEAIEEETLQVALELMDRNPDIGLILLECTVLPQYAASIQKAVEVPVIDVVSLVDLFVQGFSPASARSLF